MEILAYLSAVIIGLILGLMGGGGSILTVPVLVYLLFIPPYEATAYSLFVVGITSLAGSFDYIRQGLVDFKTAILFSIPSFAGVILTRKFLLPALPDILFTVSDFTLTKDLAIMILFASMMIFASYSMIRKNKDLNQNRTESRIRLIIKFFFVGVFLGLVGAGGGFLIVPSLIFFAKLEMKSAVGTSLVIIAVNTITGFLGDLTTSISLNWNLLLTFTLLSLAGTFAGVRLSAFIDGKKLKPVFGWLILLMGIYIISRELILK